MSEGPRAGDPDHDEGATEPVEPAVAGPTAPPDASPGPPPARERPIFVVAAQQPEPDESDEGPLFIVPAAQPVVVEPAPAEPAPVVEPSPVVEPPWPAEPSAQTAIPPAEPQWPAEPSARTAIPPAEPAPVAPGPTTWAPAWPRPAEPEPEAAWAEPEARRRRWRPGCFTILLVLLAVLIGGGIYAYQTRLVTPRLVLDAVGFGAAEVEFLNLRDDAIRADLAPASQADTVPAGLRLAPYELRTYRAVRPTRLDITLVGEDGASLGACTLDLRSGDRFQFVALPEGALVRPLGQTPGSGRDLLIAESGSCR